MIFGNVIINSSSSSSSSSHQSPSSKEEGEEIKNDQNENEMKKMINHLSSPQEIMEKVREERTKIKLEDIGLKGLVDVIVSHSLEEGCSSLMQLRCEIMKWLIMRS